MHGWFFVKDKPKEVYFYKLEVRLFYNPPKKINVTYLQLKQIFGNVILSCIKVLSFNHCQN